MAKTTAREGQLRDAAGSLTLTAQWASAEGGVTIRGLLVSCCKGRETLHCGWQGIQLRRTLLCKGHTFQSAFRMGKDLKKSNTELLYAPAISLQSTDPRELKTGTQTKSQNMNHHVHQQRKGQTIKCGPTQWTGTKHDTHYGALQRGKQAIHDSVKCPQQANPFRQKDEWLSGAGRQGSPEGLLSR